MKKSILLVFTMIFLMAGEIFAGSIVTQRVVRACGFVKGSTTLYLSGQMNDVTMQSISSGTSMAIYNSLDSYLVMPTLFPKTKNGFGAKTATQNVSVNTKNGKFKWTEKDVTTCFAFSTGREKIKPSKAVLKSKGSLQTSELSGLEYKKLTVLDKLCADQNGVYLSSLVFTPQTSGKNYKFSYNDNNLQAKGSINSKGKITAKYLINFEDAFPAFVEDGNIFTNKYDYSLIIVGEGNVRSGFYGPDQVGFRVIENNDKFRYFFYNGTKVTNDFMTLELESDTEVQAVFGTYDLSLKVIGNGSASAEFTGPDEIEVKVTENKDKFRYFTVNGERCPDSEIVLTLQEDTIVEAVFGNYDLDVTISGKGSVSYEFIGPNEVKLTAISGEEFLNSFEWDGNTSRENPLIITMTHDTELLATFREGTKYIVIDISGGPNANIYPISCLDDVPEGGWTKEYKTTKLVLRKIKTVNFTMGSPTNELGRLNNETQGLVMLTNAYYIGVFETTQKQYELITGENPVSGYWCKVKGEVRPVEEVSLMDLRGGISNKSAGKYSFFGKLKSKTHMAFDLPTEYQWECACRAGTTTALNSGKNLSNMYQCEEMDEVGRYQFNGGYDKVDYLYFKAHAEVGSYMPNAWGLYDMHGNVREICIDDGGYDYLNRRFWLRSIKGGGWADKAYECRSAYRDITVVRDVKDDLKKIEKYFSDTLGFRVTLNVNEKITPFFEFDIESGIENTLPIFQTKFYGKLKNGAEKMLEEFGKLAYDGASGIVVGAGKHQLLFTSYNCDLTDGPEIRVEYEDVTEQANYLVVDMTTNKMRVSQNGPDTTDDLCRTDELWLKRIEPGTFTMGSPENEMGRFDDETQHIVTLTNAYYIGVFETTQKQYERITGDNPSKFKGDTRPVEYVSKTILEGIYDKDNDASFLKIMRKKYGGKFDLPTANQWEYACRAGTTTALNSGKNLSDVDECGEMSEVGRYSFNGGLDKENGRHTVVGSYMPNAWGLYDMHGNVSEYCIDAYRGGSWKNTARFCRSACRTCGSSPGYYGDSGFGFRVVLVNE